MAVRHLPFEREKKQPDEFFSCPAIDCIYFDTCRYCADMHCTREFWLGVDPKELRKL